MAKATSELSEMASSIFGKAVPVLVSPQLENFDFQEPRPNPFKPLPEEFKIVLNVSYVNIDELKITYPSENLLQVEVKHDFREDNHKLKFSRDSIFRYELPAHVSAKELQAVWTVDNYLIIKATPYAAVDVRRTGNVIKPVKVTKILKPIVEIPVFRDMLEDIRDKSLYALRYLRVQTHLDPDQTTGDEERLTKTGKRIDADFQKVRESVLKKKAAEAKLRSSPDEREKVQLSED